MLLSLIPFSPLDPIFLARFQWRKMRRITHNRCLFWPIDSEGTSTNILIYENIFDLKSENKLDRVVERVETNKMSQRTPWTAVEIREIEPSRNTQSKQVLCQKFLILRENLSYFPGSFQALEDVFPMKETEGAASYWRHRKVYHQCWRSPTREHRKPKRRLLL